MRRSRRTAPIPLWGRFLKDRPDGRDVPKAAMITDKATRIVGDFNGHPGDVVRSTDLGEPTRTIEVTKGGHL